MQSTSQLFIFLLILLSIQISGCQKEPLLNQQKEIGGAVLRDGTGIPLTIEEAENYFNSYDCTHEFSADSFHIQSLNPIWVFALPIQVNGQELHVVPVLNDLDSIFPNSDYNLLFYRDTLGAIHFNLLVSTSTTGTLASNVDEMTGFWLQISEENELVSGYAIHEGYAIPFGVEILSQYQYPEQSELRGGGPKGCPGFGGGFDWDLFWIKLHDGWDSFWKDIWEYFKDNWTGGGSSGGGSSITFMDPNQSSNSGIFWSWSGAGTGAWTSSGPSGTTPLNIQGLFNNDIFNRGFRSLRKCAGEAGDGGQNATGDQQALAVAMAEVMGNADQFHHVFSIAMDMYLEAMQSGNGTVQLSDLFVQAADPLYYFNPYTFNHINPDQSILPSAYLYNQMAWFYKACRFYDGPVGAGNGIGLDDAICSCMAQQTVENAISDYILQYASAANNPFLPVNISQTERDNWAMLKNLIEQEDISNQELVDLAFIVCKPEHANYLSCISEFLADKYGVSQEMMEYAVPICTDEDLDYKLSELIDFYNETADWPWPYPSPISPPAIIENGMIVGCEGLDAEPQGIIRRIAYNAPRHEPNSEDIQANWGLTNKHFVIDALKPDSYYESRMRELFGVFTVLDSEMGDIGTAFIDKFLAAKGVYRDYSNAGFNEKVSEHPALINYTKTFAKLLNEKLKLTGGDINQIDVFKIDDENRVKFNTLFDRVNGYQILINDTEQCDIHLLSYAYNPNNNKWLAEVYIEIQDNFGLDTEDVLKFQTLKLWGWPVLVVEGFPSWGYLQHNRNYSPLKTKIWVKASIIGDLGI